MQISFHFGAGRELIRGGSGMETILYSGAHKSHTHVKSSGVNMRKATFLGFIKYTFYEEAFSQRHVAC